jgi:hypothetical protein
VFRVRRPPLSTRAGAAFFVWRRGAARLIEFASPAQLSRYCKPSRPNRRAGLRGDPLRSRVNSSGAATSATNVSDDRFADSAVPWKASATCKRRKRY